LLYDKSYTSFLRNIVSFKQHKHHNQRVKLTLKTCLWSNFVYRLQFTELCRSLKLPHFLIVYVENKMKKTNGQILNLEKTEVFAIFQCRNKIWKLKSQRLASPSIGHS